MSTTAVEARPVVARIADILAGLRIKTRPFSAFCQDSAPGYAMWTDSNSPDLMVFVVIERTTQGGERALRVRVDIDAERALNVPEGIQLMLDTGGVQSHHTPFRLDVDEREFIADLTIPVSDIEENSVLSVAL
jgi:hypothetical protein